MFKKLAPTKVENKPIHIEYENSYPIDIVHREIIDRLEQKVELVDLEDRLDLQREKMKRCRSIVERNNVRRQIDEIRAEIEALTSGKNLREYVAQAEPIVAQFTALGPYVESVRFDTDVVIEDETAPSSTSVEDINRINLIERFIQIAKRYVNITVVRVSKTFRDRCVNCGTDMSNVAVGEIGEQICPDCNTIRQSHSSGSTSIKKNSDNRRYDVAHTFRRELNQFQGIQNGTIPQVIYDELDEYFVSRGALPAEKIRHLPLDEYGKREGTSVKMLADGLKHINQRDLYKHINLIGKNLWGWRLHDLKELTPKIMENFSLTQKEFPHVEKDRSSNICSQHQLLQQLRLVGVKVDISDFKLPKMEALKASEKIWKQMVERAGLPYIPLFPNTEELGEVCTFTIA